VSKRYVVAVGLLIVLAVAVPIAIAAYQDGALQRESAAALAWAETQGLKPGKVQQLRLPADLARSTKTGSVDVAHLADGRYCVLLVTEVGWKDNFEGRLLCSRPFSSAEFVSPGDGRATYVSLPGYGIFEELYVRRARSDRNLEVYFDLN
jgi:hypothetical protein